MQEAEKPSAEIVPTPEKKHNLGAKIGVALTLGGFVGGKLATPFSVLDVNDLFPKGTPLVVKIKRTFSKEIAELFKKAAAHEMEVNGRGPMMAWLATIKWSTLSFAVIGIGLGVLGWVRAGRLQDSKDIIHQPLKSTKIILGLQEPDTVPTKPVDKPMGKHTETLVAERATQLQSEVQR